MSLKKFTRWIPDRIYISLVYYYHFKKLPNLRKPTTFNEKLQWLKLYDRKAEYTKLVDKYLVKEYVEKKIGKEHIIPTIGVWSNPDDIDFSALPNRFVLKWNHDSGSIVICDGKKFDEAKAVNSLKKGINSSGFWYGREWPYKNVEPKLIAEPYLEDFPGCGYLTDYKLHYFNGECKAIMVARNRFSENGLESDFYTPNWEHMQLARGHSHNSNHYEPKPENLNEMLSLGGILAKDYPFVRIDFYLVDSKLLFSEITFYPSSGFNPFSPPEWDYTFGKWLILPEHKGK